MEGQKRRVSKGSNPGNEKILLTWQTVLDSGKATEHSKIRMCLDGTQSNKLLYKFESEMPDLMDILLRWRHCKYWCCIDVVKMFWSIAVDPSSANLQFCVWRSSPKEKLMLFKFLRIVMGLTSSPGLARMVLLHLAKLMQKKYPLVHNVISSHTYVDDAGVFRDSIEIIIETATQVLQCL